MLPRHARTVARLLERLPGVGERTAARYVLHLLSEWEHLAQDLQTYATFQPSGRRRGIHLCGKRPSDLFLDEDVRRWSLAYLGAYYGARRPNILSTPQAIRHLIAAYQDIGMDDYVLMPTAARLDQFDRLAEVVAG